MSTKQKLSKEQKTLEKKLVGVIMFYRNLQGESVRALATLYSVSVGTVSARITEGKGVVALEPEMTFEAATELLAQVYVGNEEEPKVKPQTSPQQLAIRMVYELATQEVGIKSKEEYAIYGKVFGYTADGSCAITSTQKSYIRRRVREIARANGVNAVFVPDWFNANAPQRSLTTMTEMAHSLFERIEEMVNDYMNINQLPESARYSVRQALAGLTIEGVSPQSIERQCLGYSDVVGALTDNGAATDEHMTLDYAKEWEEGVHSVFSMPNGQCALTTNQTAKDIHKVFEDLKDLDEAGFIY